jgi:hypothetical protein
VLLAAANCALKKLSKIGTPLRPSMAAYVMEASELKSQNNAPSVLALLGSKEGTSLLKKIAQISDDASLPPLSSDEDGGGLSTDDNDDEDDSANNFPTSRNAAGRSSDIFNDNNDSVFF